LCAGQRAPSRTFRRVPRASAQGCPDQPSPGAVRFPGSRSLAVDPLQRLHVLPAVRSSRIGCRLPRGSPPLDGIIRVSPVRGGPSTSAAVPLSGFLNPSAVSWPTRTSRPCFVPQPSLGFLPFEALLLAGVAGPSRVPLASLRLDRRASNRDRSAQGLSLRVSLTPTPLARHGGQLPAGAASVVSPGTCRHASSSPTLRTLCATTTSRRHRLRPLRSLHPPTKLDRSRGRCSPGLSPLQSLAPIAPRTLRPDGPFRPSRASSRDLEGCDPSTPGEIARPRGRSTSSARPCTELPRMDTCRLSAAALPPSALALDARTRLGRDPRRREGLDQRPVFVRRGCSPEVPDLVVDLATSRPPPTLAHRFAGESSASSPRARPAYGPVVNRWPPCGDRRVATVSAVRSGFDQHQDRE
jgi:hypothetical protein